MTHTYLFINTEFTDFTNCELISIGMVTSEGKEFYGENASFDKTKSSAFVELVVYPLLEPEKYSLPKEDLSIAMYKWLDDVPAEQITIMVDYDKDYILMFELLTKMHPKIIGVENILGAFQTGNDSKNWVNRNQTQFDFLKSIFDVYLRFYYTDTHEKAHHALSDAKANRSAYYGALKKLNHIMNES